MPRTYDHFHPHPWVDEVGRLRRGGALTMVPLYGPAGLVGPIGANDRAYTGMDPSDPVTWVRPYNPQPGMIGYLNFDGANPNTGQVITGKPRGWRGVVRRGRKARS